MNKRYNESPRFSPAGVTTGAILAVVVAMAVSVLFDQAPYQSPEHTAAATTTTLTANV